MHKGILLIFALLAFGCTTNDTPSEFAQDQPNIILIMADDLGYGDLSCYGQSLFETPNIDALAKSGMLFTQHYSGSTVCAPSRSALMTGLHTGHTQIRGNKEIQPEGQYPIDAEVFTLAEMLQEQGYATGAFGKWGLGYPGSTGDPTKQGFDRFFGYNCQRLGHSYYPHHLWSDSTKYILEANRDTLEGVYAPQLIHQELLSFIRTPRDQPFFAFVPSIIPHAELKAPEAYMEQYRGQFLPENEYDGCDPGCPHFRTAGYASQKESHAAFAAMMHLLDEQVGEIRDAVRELGMEENTIILFTSDNGPHLEGGADPDYFDSNGPLKGYKRDLYEGGIRVPMIASWPGMIKEGSRSDHASASYDLYATFAHLAGANDVEIGDGISFLPELLNAQQSKHPFLYWEFASRWATPAQAVLLDGRWKAIRRLTDSTFAPIEIYDLDNDIGETQNIAAEQIALVERAKRLFVEQHNPSEVEGWDFPPSSLAE